MKPALVKPELPVEELEPTFSASMDTEIDEPAQSLRRFNIHMPEERDVPDIHFEPQVEHKVELKPEPPRQREPAPHFSRVAAQNAQVEPVSSTRTQQWDATIEELEQQARLVDDYAVEDDAVPSVLTSSTLSDVEDSILTTAITVDEEEESLSLNFNHSFNIEVEDEEVEPSIASLNWSDDEDELEETPSVKVSPAIESDWEDEPDDRDVAAFQNIISQAQANAAAQQNPF